MKKSKLILSMIDAYNMVLLDAHHHCQNKPDSVYKTDYGYFNVDNATYAIQAIVINASIWMVLSLGDDLEHPYQLLICVDRSSNDDSIIISKFIEKIEHVDNYSVESMESPMIAKDLKNFLEDIPDETKIMLCHELVGNEHDAEYVEYKDGAIKIHEARI